MGVSKTNKTYASRYKTDVSVSQTSNVGFDATTRKLCSGDGADSALSLSDDVLTVQPVNDDTTGTLLCKNSGGSNILAVDTTNSKVLMGASQVAANTQYAYFGINALESATFAANTHYMLPFSGKAANAISGMILGTGTNPDTSLIITLEADNTVDALWFIPDNITVDAVYWWSGGDAADGDTTRTHLCAFTIDTGNGLTGGDLSNGVVVADGVDITNAGRGQAYYQSLTVQSADIDAGKVAVFTFRQDGINSNMAISATIKYHIR